MIWALIFLVIAGAGMALLIWVCEHGDDAFDFDDPDALRDDQLDSVGTTSMHDQVEHERVWRSEKWQERP